MLERTIHARLPYKRCGDSCSTRSEADRQDEIIFDCSLSAATDVLLHHPSRFFHLFGAWMYGHTAVGPTHAVGWLNL